MVKEEGCSRSVSAHSDTVEAAVVAEQDGGSRQLSVGGVAGGSRWSVEACGCEVLAAQVGGCMECGRARKEEGGEWVVRQLSAKVVAEKEE